MRLTIALPAVLPILGACGGEATGPGPGPAQLAGTWEATKIELVSSANSNVREDLFPQGGRLTLTLAAGGAFTIEFTSPGEPPLNLAGTWSASVDVLSLSFTAGLSGQWEFGFALNVNTLTLGGADTEYDFDGDDQDEPAKLNLVLTRAS